MVVHKPRRGRPCGLHGFELELVCAEPKQRYSCYRYAVWLNLLFVCGVCGCSVVVAVVGLAAIVNVAVVIVVAAIAVNDVVAVAVFHITR